MKKEKSILKDRPFLVGLVLIILSLLLFLFLQTAATNKRIRFMDDDAYHFVNFGMAILYFMWMLVTRFFRQKPKYPHLVISLILFSISCFSLNITLPIFSNFSTWVDVYLIAMHVALFVTCFDSKLPQVIKTINFFILGLGAIICLYFSIYLSPLLPVAFIGLLFFGLSLHLFVPMALCVTIITYFIKRSSSTSDKVAFYSGLIVPLVIVALFITKWNNTRQAIHKATATIVTRPENKLPNWILLSQELDDGFFMDRILKSGIQYEAKMFGDIDRIGFNTSMNEIIEHDPLVALGSAIMGEIDISKEDRIKIMASKFDLRHHLKRKLWSGSHLTTSSVISNTKIYPDHRLAYTEKIITIKNNFSEERWNRQEEALYTFHLPEGSVATSLSLWIEGVEEKSRLTTKKKADKAYSTIVGVERRDPSILHWQEGNTITVYVFPCTPEEERMFKIGITTPMENDGDNLILPNIYFEGPPSSDALETSIVEFISDHKVKATMPKHFDGTAPYNYAYTGNYRSYWVASCLSTPISNAPFSFQGHSYRMTNLEKTVEQKNIENVYLDINKSWSPKQFESILTNLADKNVYVIYDQPQLLTDENRAKLFDVLSRQNFSLFPFHEIIDPNNSLVITNSSRISPALIDLEKSKFVVELKAFLSERSSRINLYDLGDDLSPYLRTLKEFQIFNYVKGSESHLYDLLSKEVYVNDNTSPNRVELEIAKVSITRDSIETKSTAPDHLMRLFSYNKIMQDCGRNYFTNEDFVQEELIDVANEAFIVSPISSLIVLETQKDYDRFGIKKNKNSLQNATTSSSGAVPEPHEWALIILLCSTMLYMYYKKRQATLIAE